MTFIKFLKPQVISQISAGEIIERPSSVVKELIENSIDAQANNIQISIQHGGIKSIKIQDDGIGINKKELLISVSPYSTSKIERIEDLKLISSFGFRGEALSSINSISRIKLTSKTKKQEFAWQIYLEASILKFIKPEAHPLGTTLEVLDLFYNHPVKKKFIKTYKTEFIYIEEVVKIFALSHFKLSFTLIHNNKIIKKYPSVNKKRDRLIDIFGSFIIENSFVVKYSYDKLNIFGFILKPSAYKKYKKIGQYFFINQRLINNKIVKHAIRQAHYDNNDLQYIQPSYLLYLKINKEIIDINYHPKKKDVLLESPRIIHDFIYQSISNVFKKKICFNNKKISGINIFSIPEFKIKILKNKKINTKKFFLKKDFLKICNEAYQNYFSFKTFGKLLTVIDQHALIKKNKNIFIFSIYEAKILLLKKKIKLNFIKNKNFISYEQTIFLLQKLEILYPELILNPPKRLIKNINIDKQIKNFDKNR